MRLNLLILGSIMTMASAPASAYIGPGLGLGAIGAVLGVIFALFLALYSLAWHPIKRLFVKKKDTEELEELEEAEALKDAE